MTHSGQHRFFALVFRSAISFLMGVALLPTIAIPAAQAQTYTVLHNFTGRGDGATPIAGLTLDAGGNLYGTTVGDYGNCTTRCGTVFQMKKTGSGWILNPLYKFTGGADGSYPYAGVVFGPDGALYGTTQFGGEHCPSDSFNQNGCGVVFRLAPQPTICHSYPCPWRETVLYTFPGGYDDGAMPLSRVAFDQAGNLYGTTVSGGHFNCIIFGYCGTIYKLTHANGYWTEDILYRFTGDSDGGGPFAGLTPDAAGNFYGVAYDGGDSGNGTVFELTPSGLNTLIELPSNASMPESDLIFDPAGNLYGTTSDGENGGGATAFELTPSGGNWNFSIMYSFDGTFFSDGPNEGLVRDSAGNLYGTTHGLGSYNRGTVFKLTPSNGGWIYTVLHEFSDEAGGDYPMGGVAIDAQGNLYGTAQGGYYGYGVLWEITP